MEDMGTLIFIYKSKTAFIEIEIQGKLSKNKYYNKIIK